MNWFDGVRFVFGSVTYRQSATDTFIQILLQSSLTIGAAFLGAWAADHFHKKREKNLELQNRKLMAISTMLKMSMASSALHSLYRTFFNRIPNETAARDYWRFVLPAVPIQDSIGEFSSEEFSFLLADDDDADLAYRCAEVLNHTKICIAIINHYSLERRTLADMLDQHTVDFDTTRQEVEAAINLQEFPNIRRKQLEISLLCEQMHSNLIEAIANSNRAITMFNNQVTDKVGDPAFRRRLVVTELDAR